ncbi:MAG: hypothetical protein ABIQ88_23050 [Chitinophagaceae bacterium]
MKKLVSLSILCGFIINAGAQKLDAKDVPAPVTDAFNTKYPSTKDANWKKDGKYYTVEYDINKLHNAVTYEINGGLIATDEGLPVLNLPKCVADYVRLKYPRNKIKKASKMTDADHIVSFSAKVDDQRLRFDSSCNLMSAEKAVD